MHRALTDKNEEAKIIEWICQNDKEFDEAKSNGYDLRMDESEIIYWMDKYAKAQTAEGSQAELLVMPMLTDIEVKSGWEAWLNNSFKAYKKDFSDKLRKSNKRSGVIETPKKWIENYYKELLEITERYLNASKHLS